MKKTLSGIIAFFCAVCLCWGVGMLNLSKKSETTDAASQQNNAAVSAPASGGVKFSAGTFFDSGDLFSEIPHTFEAVIKVTDGGSSRTGIIIGNFFNGSAGTAQAAINFEIGAGGVPKVFALMKDGDNTQHNFIFTKLSTLNTQTGIAGFLNDYFHVAIAIDSANNSASLYINGTLAQTVTNAGVPTYDAMKVEDLVTTSSTGEIRSMRVGGDYRLSNAYYFKGEIKSVSVFGDLRSASEIAADFTASSTASVVSSTDKLEMCYDLTSASSYYTTVNEPAGGIVTTHVKDLSQNMNDLTYSVAEGDGGITFNVDTVIEMPALTKAPRTVEAMFKLPANYTQRAGVLLGNYQNGESAYLSYELYNGNNVCEPRVCAVKPGGKTNNLNLSGVHVGTGKIVHLTLVYDDANNLVIGYLNGVHAFTNSAGAVDFDSAEKLMGNNFMIGGDHRTNPSQNAQYFKGTLYSIVAYSDVRTPDEVAGDYAYAIASETGYGANVSNADMICAYDFSPLGGTYFKNSVTGETYSTSTPTTIKDNSANGIDLTANITTGSNATVFAGLSVKNDDEYRVAKK